MTRYNVPLIEQVRDVIADEDKHDQSLWARISKAALGATPKKLLDKFGYSYVEVSCPTAACVAGWAATLAGAQMVIPQSDYRYQGNGSIQVQDVLVDGEVKSIARFAREQLGLTSDEADALFAAEWTNEDVLDNLDDILCAARHGQDWEIRYVEEEDGDY